MTQDIGPEHIPKEELSKAKLCSLVTVTTPLIELQHWRMRTYTLLMRSTARLFAAVEKKSFRDSDITPLALEKSENYWVKQSMTYTSDAMKKGHLKSLRAKYDKNGVIILSSRAEEGLKSHYNQDTFPILMSADPFAFLYMKHVHDESHSGRMKTIAKSRRKYWIVRAVIDINC